MIKLKTTTESNNKIKKEIFAFNQEHLSSFLRKDEFPGPLELQQYKIRFEELFDNISKLSLEIKEYYSVFNYLKEVRAQIESEISLVMSIKANIPLLGNRENQRQMQDKLYDWISAANKHKSQAQTKLDNERIKRSNLDKEVDKLTEYQILYLSLLKEFKEKI